MGSDLAAVPDKSTNGDTDQQDEAEVCACITPKVSVSAEFIDGIDDCARNQRESDFCDGSRDGERRQHDDFDSIHQGVTQQLFPQVQFHSLLEGIVIEAVAVVVVVEKYV